MKNFQNWFASSWTESLGWALLHSLWQSLLIFVLIAVAFRFISKRDATLRYIIATAGLTLMFVAFIGTFVYRIAAEQQTVSADHGIFANDFRRNLPSNLLSGNFVEGFTSSIQSNIHLMTICWMIGTFFFALRLAGGWWYVSTLRTQSSEVNGYWHEQLINLAHQLNISFIPVLAESARISAPVVIGYLKPVILLPAGMIAGLSTDQIEAILLHELTHIKRHDYIVNILQSLIETVLFFNPFVWITSSLIRNEREHCCDDAVLKYSNPRTYALALAQLEELRLSRHGLALSLAENKNQLLNRIKRIMEKSVKNYSSREKMIPVLLLITCLVCASWITLQSQEPAKVETRVVPADTTKEKSESGTYRYKSVTTVGEDGKPKEEIVQYYSGDSDVPPLFAMPPVPDINFVPPMALMAPMPDFHFAMPPVPPHAEWNSGEWEAFGKEFETKFREQFGDFYDKHQKDFDKMMQDVETNLKTNFDERWAEEFAASKESHEAALAAHAQAVDLSAESMAAHQEALQEMEQHMSEWQEAHGEHMKELEVNMKKMEANMHAFEKELHETLIKDGYLKKDEKIKNIHWKNNGDIEINDISIKAADLPKYRALHDKYFKDDGAEFHYVD
jgi:bla regulator protein BlaR1